MHNRGLSNETPFGRLLRAFREAASLSQEELAERSQLSWRAITALERGERRRPRPRTVRMLADALNLPDKDRDRLLASVPGAAAGQHGGWSTLAPVVAQLPAAVADFTCRGAEVDQLASLLRLAADGRSATIVAAISGKAGIGKSTLAVHVAHLVRPDFPDGQLYADLGGPDALVESPADVLAGFLRALGVAPSAIPVAVPERAALYRSLLAGRRWLVLIDDARGEEQVRDLVPGTAGCAVLVTSRRRLTALAGADQCHLGDLDVDCGARLLGRIAGDDRIQSERWAAEAIVTRCGGLPLAIRVAGAVLRRKPHWPLARLAGRLADERRLLDDLRVSDLDVRASFALSYRELAPALARVFRRLPLLPGPDFPVAAVGPLIGDVPTVAESALEQLHDAQLVETAGDHRYRLHDLLRIFARERLEAEESEPERRRSVRAVLPWYGREASVRAATLGRNARAHPVPPEQCDIEVRSALDWFDRERAGLAGALAAASGEGLHELALDLAIALREFFSVRGHWMDEEQVYRIALEAARPLGDARRETLLLNHLGTNLRNQGRLLAAIATYRQGLELARAASDQHGEALVLNNLGVVYRYQARLGEAAECQLGSLAIYTELGDGVGRARALNSLGVVYSNQGRYAEAIACLTESLGASRRHGEWHLEGWTLQNLAHFHSALGRRQEALASLDAAIEVYQQLDDRDCEAWAHATRGFVYADQRRWPEALESCQRGLAMLREFGDRMYEAWTLVSLGSILRDTGATGDAAAHAASALDTFRELGVPDGESAALNCLGEIHRAEGRSTPALACHRESLAIARRGGDRAGEAETLCNLGDVHGDQERWTEAEAEYDAALVIQRELQDGRRESLTLAGLARLHQRSGQLAQAASWCEKALDSARRRGDHQDEADFLVVMGDLRCGQGRSDEAMGAFERSLAIACELGYYQHGEAAARARIAELGLARTEPPS